MGYSGRSLRARLLVFCAAALVALACLEAGLRLLSPPPPSVRLEQFAKVVRGKHEVDFERVFERDPELFWRLAPNVVLPDDAWPLFGRISNGSGLREEREIPFEKPEGEIRILFIGDSCTFGYLEPLEQSIPSLVEAELAAEHPEARIECINAGVPGYTLFQGWRYLETEGLAYDPDLVVSCFGWNATSPWGGIGDAEQLEIQREAVPPAFLAWSRGFQILWEERAARRHPVPEGAAGGPALRPRLTPDEFLECLRRVHGATRRAGAELMILVPASQTNFEGPRLVRTLYQEAQFEFMKRFATGSAEAPMLVDGIRILRSFKKQDPDVELFHDGVHTRAAANARIASRVAGRISAWIRGR